MESAGEKEPLLTSEQYKIQNTESGSITDNTKHNKISWRCYFLAPIIFLQFYCYVLVMTSMQQYSLLVFQKMYFPNETSNATDGEPSVCQQDTSSQEYKDQQKVQSLASELTMYFTLVNNIPAIFTCIICGSYSDRFGRKPFILAALLGTWAKAGLCAIGIFFDLNIYIFIAFYAVEGLTGTWISSLMALMAAAADITEASSSRTVAIVLIEMCLGIGAVTGMLSSGYIIKFFGFKYANIIGFGLVGLAILIALTLLPETNEKARNQLKKDKLENLKNAFKFYTQKNFSDHGERWQYILCLAIFLLINTSLLGKYTTESLYVLDSPFCWSSVELGWYGALRSGVQSVVGMLFIRPLQHCFGDESIAIMGSLSNIASCLLEALTSNDIVMFMVPVVGAFSIMQAPVIRSIMSKMTSPDAQGALFAGIAAMEAVCNLTSSVAASGIYAATVSIFRGLVFIVLAGINFLAVVLLVILKIKPGDPSIAT